MYAIIYEFTIKQGKTNTFIDAWSKVTKAYVQHCNGLGSRLHQVEDHTYWAYAQWPSKADRELAQLPAEANYFGEIMRECCSSIKVIQKMNMVEDLLL